jgi:hypothetical protein
VEKEVNSSQVLVCFWLISLIFSTF